VLRRPGPTKGCRANDDGGGGDDGDDDDDDDDGGGGDDGDDDDDDETISNVQYKYTSRTVAALEDSPGMQLYVIDVSNVHGTFIVRV